LGCGLVIQLWARLTFSEKIPKMEMPHAGTILNWQIRRHFKLANYGELCELTHRGRAFWL
jgi:hypothetical protein